VLGQVCPFAGATVDHSRIAFNIAAALLPAARTVGDLVVRSDQKLRPGNDLY
jgi:hypothetical protein